MSLTSRYRAEEARAVVESGDLRPGISRNEQMRSPSNSATVMPWTSEPNAGLLRWMCTYGVYDNAPLWVMSTATRRRRIAADVERRGLQVDSEKARRADELVEELLGVAVDSAGVHARTSSVRSVARSRGHPRSRHAGARTRLPALRSRSSAEHLRLGRLELGVGQVPRRWSRRAPSARRPDRVAAPARPAAHGGSTRSAPAAAGCRRPAGCLRGARTASTSGEAGRGTASSSRV